MTIEQKLSQLYAASRIAQLNADQHEALRQYADEILQAIKSIEPEPKAE
jgi:hypothetical protein